MFKSWLAERSQKDDIINSVYRIGSEAYADSFVSARDGKLKASTYEEWLIKNTDIGRWGTFGDERVPLDMPLHASNEMNEKTAVYDGEEVELDSPKYGGTKKYVVYTKDKDGKVVKVQFGWPGLSVKMSDLERSKNFSARHNCPAKDDKTKAGWWSCHLPKFAKALGLSEPAYKYW